MSDFKKNWTLDETDTVIDIVRKQNTLKPVGKKKYRSIDAFDNVSRELIKYGYIRSAEQIRRKIKGLKQDFYMAIKKPLKEAKAECPLFDKLKEIFSTEPGCHFVRVSNIPHEIEKNVEIPAEEIKRTHPIPRRKKRLNLDKSIMFFIKDFMQQQKKNVSENFVPANQLHPEKLSSEVNLLERVAEPCVDLCPQNNSTLIEDPNLNFLKSLLPDLNKLSESRQRIFKQRALVHLYKLLEDEELDRANMKE